MEWEKDIQGTGRHPYPAKVPRKVRLIYVEKHHEKGHSRHGAAAGTGRPRRADSDGYVLGRGAAQNRYAEQGTRKTDLRIIARRFQQRRKTIQRTARLCWLLSPL